MSEWSKEPDSKSGVVLCITEGSNPSLSEEMEASRKKCLWRGVRVVEGARLEVVYGRKPSGVRIPPSPFSSRYLAMRAAQPRQGRDAAAVSGMRMRPRPFAAVFVPRESPHRTSRQGRRQEATLPRSHHIQPEASRYPCRGCA